MVMLFLLYKYFTDEFCYSVDVYYFRLDFPLLAAVPLIKRETDGTTDAEGVGANVFTAATKADPSTSPFFGVEVRPGRGADAARMAEELVDAPRVFGKSEVKGRGTSWRSGDNLQKNSAQKKLSPNIKSPG
jgi:hypothetical protein